MIPGGDVFILNPPLNSATFTWIVDVLQATELAFTMTDAKGRSGGVSNLLSVKAPVNSNNSCLTGDVPTTLSIQPSQVTAGANGPTATNSSGGSSSSGVSAGVIAGAIIGSLLAVAVAATLLWFFWWRRRGAMPYRSRRRDPNVNLFPETAESAAPAVNPYPYRGAPSATGEPDTPPSSSYLLHQSGQFEAQSYLMTNPHSATSRSSSEMDSSIYGGASPLYGAAMASGSQAGLSVLDPTLSPARRKGSITVMTTHRQPRFVMHTDAEDVNLPPQEDEVIELPPQYTERRVTGRPSTIAEETNSGYSMPLASSSGSTPSQSAIPLPPPSALRDATPSAQSTSANVLDRLDVAASDRLQEPMKPSPAPTPVDVKSSLP